jgi:hypothetical protein
MGDEFYDGNGRTRKRRFISNTLYRGGFVDFSPQVNSSSEFDTAVGPGKISALDDLCYYWTNAGLTNDLDFTSPTAATTFLKRYVASHWTALLQYNMDVHHRHKYTIYRAAKITDISTSKLEQCWSTTESLNNRVACWVEQIDSSIQQLRATGTLGDFPGQHKNISAEDDFLRLSLEFQEFKRRVEALVTSLTSLLSIYETKRMKELSNLGMLFVPLAFTSGIFSMSGNYAPGEASFWVYWVVAIPLVILMFAAVFGLNSGQALVNSWLFKTRVFNHSSFNKISWKPPGKPSGSSV